MSTRINARLDDELATRVDEARRRTGMSLTQVIEAALKLWTAQEARARPNPMAAFQRAGFIASGRGPRSLARDAKAELSQSLKRKA